MTVTGDDVVRFDRYHAEEEILSRTFDALLGDDQVVALPDGITLASYDNGGYKLSLDGWRTRWRTSRPAPEGSDLPYESFLDDSKAVPVTWDGEWAQDTIAAASRPDADETVVARMIVEDLIVGAGHAVAHEFFELSRLRGRFLWANPHPGMAATATLRTVFESSRWAVQPETDFPEAT